jgi:nickel transport protein
VAPGGVAQARVARARLVQGRVVRRSFAQVALALLLGVLLAGAALAHGLRVSAQAEAEGLRGQAFYADGSPARDETVTLFAGDAAQPQAQARTDAEGRFRLPLTSAGRYRVVVDGDEGHRGEAAVVWAPLAATAASGAEAAQIAAAVRAEVAPLREDIARLQARVRLSDLVGGIGLIVGAAGLLAWWRARRGSR